MKPKAILIGIFSILLLALLILQACKKDKETKESPSQPFYTNGQGVIGTLGGTVMIDDPGSPINGTSVEIPAGALTSKTNIKIVLVNGEVIFPADSAVTLITFEPEGQEFENLIKITLAFNGNNIQKAVVYEYDTLKDAISETPITETDAPNKLVTIQTDHFGTFAACEKYLEMSMEMIHNAAEERIGTLLSIDGWNTYENGNGTFFEGFQKIPVKASYWPSLGNTAGIVAENGELSLYSIFTLKLYNSDFFTPYLQKLCLYLHSDKQGENYFVSLLKDGESTAVYETTIETYDGAQGLEKWISGTPMIFYFDQFALDPDQEYWVRTEWDLALEANEAPSLTSHFELNNISEKKKIGDMENINSVDIYNNYLQSDYVVQGDPGTAPEVSLEMPTSIFHQGLITIYLTITDAEGKDNDLSIFFDCPDMGKTPATLESSTGGHLEGNKILDLSPGSYSFQWNSFADFPFNHTDQMKIRVSWHNDIGGVDEIAQTSNFVVDNPGNGNYSPTAYFTNSEYFGTTSTIFEFDASASRDEEDPTELLQVRWDLDGDDIWDTDWAFEKTISHQFEQEGSKTVILEIKDTEDLRGIFSRHLTIDNGGIEGTFTDPRNNLVYNTVVIGEQTWFAQNLNYLTFDSWNYDNDPANGEIYGRLYTWEMAQHVCPDGWHLPSDEEWKQLESFLGMPSCAVENYGCRWYNEGQMLKSTEGWNINTGTNAYGFTAIPGGYRDINHAFKEIGEYACWWTISYIPNYPKTWIRDISTLSDMICREHFEKEAGFSVRCVKD
jgi:uncharacterized protein (TIGR02145 family)